MCLCVCVQTHDKQQNLEDCIRLWLLHQALSTLCILKCLTVFPLQLTEHSNGGKVTQWLMLYLGLLSLPSCDREFWSGCRLRQPLFTKVILPRQAAGIGKRDFGLTSHLMKDGTSNSSAPPQCCIAMSALRISPSPGGRLKLMTSQPRGKNPAG